MKVCSNVILFIFLILSCTPENKRCILVSKDSSQKVTQWLLSIDSEIAIKEFYTLPEKSMQDYLKNSVGIVITGGVDVNPNLYNKPEYMDVCGEIDDFRDSIEIVMIKYAMENRIPLLGICRGQQVINVVNGGTLIPDIPSFVETNINHRSKSDSVHWIYTDKNSWIKNKFNLDSAIVNSRHHQSVDKIAVNFVVAAYSSDSIIESIEIKESENHPFAIAVQWHPEMLEDSLSIAIGEFFLDQVKN